MNCLQNPLPSRNLLVILAIPMLLALGISSYLTYASITSSEIAGCNGGKIFDCGHVLYSKWSKLAAFPVSGLAMLTYTLMLFATAVVSLDRLSNGIRHNSWTAVTGLSIAASLAAVYFIFLQVVVLKHLCAYCLIAHGCGLAITFMVLRVSRISMPRLTSVASMAAVGIAVMVAVQINSKPPKTYIIKTYQPFAYSGTNVAFQADFTSGAVDDDDLFKPPVDDDLFLPPVDDEQDNH